MSLSKKDSSLFDGADNTTDLLLPITTSPEDGNQVNFLHGLLCFRHFPLVSFCELIFPKSLYFLLEKNISIGSRIG